MTCQEELARTLMRLPAKNPTFLTSGGVHGSFNWGFPTGLPYGVPEDKVSAWARGEDQEGLRAWAEKAVIAGYHTILQECYGLEPSELPTDLTSMFSWADAEELVWPLSDDEVLFNKVEKLASIIEALHELRTQFMKALV